MPLEIDVTPLLREKTCPCWKDAAMAVSIAASDGPQNRMRHGPGCVDIGADGPI